jgi:quercetin dioxygenase-like cupin family protein
MTYVKGFYKGLKRGEVVRKIKDEGFDPVVIDNTPGYVYTKHKHPETKLLAILSGSMQVEVEGQRYILRKDDKLIIPGNVYHSAVVGKDGCKFFWSEKII